MKSNAVASPRRRPVNRQAGRSSVIEGDALIKQLLSAMQRGAAGIEGIRIDLPRDEDIRMRTLVHRGTQRPVFKVASVKLGRVVQCESILEYEAALLLDVFAQIRAFAEQPARIHYLTEGQWRSHIPDFFFVIDDVPTFLEIKFQKDVDEGVLARTKLMEAGLAELGASYRLLTEVNIRQGDVVQNATRILRRARHTVSEPQMLQVLNKLRNAGQLSLAAFGWSDVGSFEAVCIAKLIASGQAVVEMLASLSDSSHVRLKEVAREEGGAIWLPAASV